MSATGARRAAPPARSRALLAWDVRRFPTLSSTSSWVAEQAQGGGAEGLVAVAGHQSAGRGRLGREWVAPPGSSLLVSVLLRPDLPAGRLHLVGAVAALAASDACAAEAGVRPGVKWPNDLVVAGRKLAGVLCEVLSGAVVVGVGLNVDWPAGSKVEGMVTLAEAAEPEGGPGALIEALLDSMLSSLRRRYLALRSEDGRRVQAAEHERRCETIGAEVEVHLPGSTLRGTARGINADGHLLLDDGASLQEVAVGEVVHLRSAPGGPAPGAPAQGGGAAAK